MLAVKIPFVGHGAATPDVVTTQVPVPSNHFYEPPKTEQHDVPWRDFQQATKFAVIAGLLAAAFYLTFVYDRSHENVPLLWVATLIGESIVVLHTASIWSTLVSYRPDIPESEDLAVIRRSLITGEIEVPTVDVFICCAGEPEHVILKTVIAAQEMFLPHNTWILDDGRKASLREAAMLLGVGYLRRENNAHAKAGNVNTAFQRTNGRFVVILDADHVPRPDLLTQCRLLCRHQRGISTQRTQVIDRARTDSARTTKAEATGGGYGNREDGAWSRVSRGRHLDWVQ